ncbi:MAG: phenylalanine--tRNA ligase beta subunit-related protein [Solirubrobacterales bacterium]
MGWCASEVREAFPDLRLVVAETELEHAGSLTGSSPHGIRERLETLSDRWTGAQAVMVRRQAVPAAYRVFFRHIGLDPDVQRTPMEEAVLERMFDGGFLSRGLLRDVLLLALVDTGVPVWALDAETLDGPLGVRLSRRGESLGRAAQARQLQDGQLVVADASVALGPLFGELAPGHGVHAGTRSLALFALQVPGVPELNVEEALWSAQSTLEWAARGAVE